MKYIFFLLALYVLQLKLNAQNNDFAGDWQGKLANTELRIIFHFVQTGRALTATLDSPDQGARGMKCDTVIVIGDTIQVKLNSAAASYSGVLSVDKNTITGKWSQRGASIGLDLEKGVTAAIRPQTPQPPFAYISEEVAYDNGDKSVHFGATFTKPKGGGKFPAAIIISGSGTQDRNGSMFDHQPYAVLADHLTKKGIAVLRVDDRGAGKTTLGKDVTKVTSADFAQDVEAGMDFLKSRADVDPKQIGLIGHSEGGIIAPMVAARNKAVAFIVLLAGPGQKGETIWKYQMRNAFIQPNLTEENKKLADTLVNKMNDAFKHSADLKTIQQEMTATYKEWKKNISDSLEKTLFKAPVGAGFYQVANSSKNNLVWLQYFLNFDPATYLQQVKCPVLAINGEADIQVTATENLAAIEAALQKGSHKKYTIKAFPQLNHLFQTTNSPGQPYGAIEETFSPTVLNFISQWIRQQTK